MTKKMNENVVTDGIVSENLTGEEPVTTPKKKRGRPKMTEEQKEAARKAREAKKAAKKQMADPDNIDVDIDNPDDDPSVKQNPGDEPAFDFDDLGDAWGSDGSDEETGESEDATFDHNWFGESASVTTDIPTKDVSQIDKDLASFIMDKNARIALHSIQKLSRGEIDTVKKFSKKEASILVSSYYSVQGYRMALGNQKRALAYNYGVTKDDYKAGNIPPSMEIITWLYNNILGIENEIKKCLGIYSLSTEVGRWLQSIIGIGPVLSAAMISFFDIDRAPSVSHFYSYSGLNDNNDPWLGKDRAKELVDKYTRVHKHGYTQYETDMAIKKRLEEMREEGKEIPEVPSLKKPDSAEVQKFCKEIGCDETYFKAYAVEHKAKVVSDDELKLIEMDPCHQRSFTKLLKMATDPKSGKQLKETLTANLAKPPYNRTLKKILYLIGESFVKVNGKPGSLYGRLYREKKAELTMKSNNGEFAERAKQILATKKFDKDTVAKRTYEEGRLPEAHIHMMAIRYAEKIFVSHLFDEMYIDRFNAQPPRLYVEVYKDHHDIIGPEVPYTRIDPNKPQSGPRRPVERY